MKLTVGLKFKRQQLTFDKISSVGLLDTDRIEVKELNEVEISRFESENFMVFLSIFDNFDLTSRQV